MSELGRFGDFFCIFGVFDRVARLREEPLLVDIYKEVDALRNSNLEDLLSAESATRYVGPEKDKENFAKDRQNMILDFCRAFGLAKQRLGT